MRVTAAPPWRGSSSREAMKLRRSTEYLQFIHQGSRDFSKETPGTGRCQPGIATLHRWLQWTMSPERGGWDVKPSASWGQLRCVALMSWWVAHSSAARITAWLMLD